MTPDSRNAIRVSAFVGLIDPESSCDGLVSALHAAWTSLEDRRWLCVGLCERIISGVGDTVLLEDFLARALAAEMRGIDVERLGQVLPGIILATECDLSIEAWRLWGELRSFTAEEIDGSAVTQIPSATERDRVLAQVVFDACRRGWSVSCVAQLSALGGSADRPWLDEATGMLSILGLLRRLGAGSRAADASIGRALRAMDDEARRAFLHMQDERTGERFRAVPLLSDQSATWHLRVPTDMRRSVTLFIDELAVGRVTIIPVGEGDVRLEDAEGVLRRACGKDPVVLHAARAAAGTDKMASGTEFWNIRVRVLPGATEWTVSLGGRFYADD